MKSCIDVSRKECRALPNCYVKKYCSDCEQEGCVLCPYFGCEKNVIDDKKIKRVK